MKKYQYSKIGLIACVAVHFATMQAHAVNLAAASGILADVAVTATQASSALAVAASSGDVAAIADAQERANKVDFAMAEAQEAYAAMERETAAGNEDAAAAAAEDLADAQQKAGDALDGELAQQEEGETSDAKRGGSGNAGVPNIYDVPWQSDGLRRLSQSLFDTAWTASGKGGSRFAERFGERQATPE